MPKELRIEVIAQSGDWSVLVIVEQPDGPIDFTAKNGLSLVYHQHPLGQGNFYEMMTLYIRGTNKEYDLLPIIVCTFDLPRIREAVAEFNATLALRTPNMLGHHVIEVIE